MLIKLKERFLEDAPAWVPLGIGLAALTSLAILVPPLFRDVQNVNACKSAFTDARDDTSLDAAFADCEARGMALPRR